MKLDDIRIPEGAQERAWRVVRAAFEERERVPWPRRHWRPLLGAVVVAAATAAAFTPPGRAVLNSIRDAVGREKVVGVRPAHRELVRLPAAGRLLVNSSLGPWIVEPGGARRLLGPYRMASWSPHGLFVAAVRDYELVALDPKGNVRWTIGRKQRLAFPRWSFDGFRIAYLSDRSLRVVVGDGSRDWGLGSADSRVAPAWRPGTHEVAFRDLGGGVRIVDADARRLLWRASAAPTHLEWSSDGRLLLAVSHSSLAVYAADGRRVLARRLAGVLEAAALGPRDHRFAVAEALGGGLRSDVLVLDADGPHAAPARIFSGAGRFTGLAWSPDGLWLLVAWRSADEWLFVRSTGVNKIVAVADIARQFNPRARGPAAFPRLAGWCCG